MPVFCFGSLARFPDGGDRRSLARSHTSTKAATSPASSARARAGKAPSQAGETRDRVPREIEPLEREQCYLIYLLAQPLVDFTARKSFTNWQREMLHDWLHELIRYLESNPFRGEMDLEPLFMEIQANTSLHLDEAALEQQCEFIRQMMIEICGQCPHDPETLREMVKNPEKMRDYLSNIAQGNIAGEADIADDDDNPFDDDDLDDLFADEEPFGQEQQGPYTHGRQS
ncbi:hypothetical protein [Aeromonas salmonicida]|uniref:hypothetical protein n=1 Tax=Aeromonas salmonicida TaxID=645 RepID=UPI00370CFF44